MSNQIIELCRQMPPLERSETGALCRMTPEQSKRAARLIRRCCCNCVDGECLLLDEGDGCVCPQMISQAVCCKWFRYVILKEDPELETEIFGQQDKKLCCVCGAPFIPKSNRSKYCAQCGQKMKRIKAAERKRKQRSLVTL